MKGRQIAATYISQRIQKEKDSSRYISQDSFIYKADNIENVLQERQWQSFRKNAKIQQQEAVGKETALAAIQPGYICGVSGNELKTKPENKDKTK